MIVNECNKINQKNKGRETEVQQKEKYAVESDYILFFFGIHLTNNLSFIHFLCSPLCNKTFAAEPFFEP